MGLDWCLETKGDYARMEEKLTELRELPTDSWRRTKIRDQVRSAVEAGTYVTPLDVLGAKRLWLDDEEALGAFKAVWESHRENASDRAKGDRYAEFWMRPFEEVAAEQEGALLADTIDHSQDGVGKVTGIMVGPESFRGKVIGYADCVPDHLKQRAYEDMTPEQMREYADDLSECVDMEATYDEDSSEHRVQLAVRWLWFWSQRGFSMHAWY